MGLGCGRLVLSREAAEGIMLGWWWLGPCAVLKRRWRAEWWNAGCG